MRERFEQQLEKLHVELITMGALCEEAISAAAKALESDDESLLHQVWEADSAIDQKEKEIESLCLKLLLQQQPVARDLREISSALKMISDMERIGDQASDIGDISRYIQGEIPRSGLHIKEMAQAAVHMVTVSVESFVRRDLAMAQEAMDYDNVIDELFVKVKQDLIDWMSKNPDTAETAMDLLMVAKYLERIGDHAQNIAEWVVFSLTGIHAGEKE
jgi:phosphate transport system protein